MILWYNDFVLLKCCIIKKCSVTISLSTFNVLKINKLYNENLFKTETLNTFLFAE